MPIQSAPQSDAQTIEFLVLCLENSGKACNRLSTGGTILTPGVRLQTDFEEVAKHSKITKNASAAYKKVWELKRKFRAQQSDRASSGSNPLATPKSPTRVMKPRSSKTKKGTYKEVASEKDGEDE